MNDFLKTASDKILEKNMEKTEATYEYFSPLGKILFRSFLLIFVATYLLIAVYALLQETPTTIANKLAAAMFIFGIFYIPLITLRIIIFSSTIYTNGFEIGRYFLGKKRGALQWKAINKISKAILVNPLNLGKQNFVYSLHQHTGFRLPFTPGAPFGFGDNLNNISELLNTINEQAQKFGIPIEDRRTRPYKMIRQL